MFINDYIKHYLFICYRFLPQHSAVTNIFGIQDYFNTFSTLLYIFLKKQLKDFKHYTKKYVLQDYKELNPSFVIDHSEFNLNGFYLLNFQLKMLSPRLKLCLFMFTFMLLTKQMFLLLDLSLQVILESTAYGEMWM